MVSRYDLTNLDKSAGSMLGTVRMENLPMTLAGITVFAPGAENAPSIPWSEREGYRHRCMSVFFSSGNKAVVFPIASWSSVIVNARSL